MVRQLPPTDAEGPPLAQGIVPLDATEVAPGKAKASRASQKPVELPDGPDRTDDPPEPSTELPVALQPSLQAPAPTGGGGRRIDLPPRSAMPSVEEAQLLHWLSATAGKLGKTLQRAEQDLRTWESAVASARRGGIDEYTIMAAAMRARVAVPDLEGGYGEA